jgi:hypothetical protein
MQKNIAPALLFSSLLTVGCAAEAPEPGIGSAEGAGTVDEASDVGAGSDESELRTSPSTKRLETQVSTNGPTIVAALKAKGISGLDAFDSNYAPKCIGFLTNGFDPTTDTWGACLVKGVVDSDSAAFFALSFKKKSKRSGAQEYLLQKLADAPAKPDSAKQFEASEFFTEEAGEDALRTALKSAGARLTENFFAPARFVCRSADSVAVCVIEPNQIGLSGYPYVVTVAPGSGSQKVVSAQKLYGSGR